MAEGISGVGISNDDGLIPDDDLFKDPPPKEECQICMQPMPFYTNSNGMRGAQPMYQPCCGKSICSGCMISSIGEMKEGNMKQLCPFCRIPMIRSTKEYVMRVKKRMKLNDAEAFCFLGLAYKDGDYGLPQDHRKEFELLNRAAELGSINAHHYLSRTYYYGEGVEKDEEKALHQYKLAAIGGHEGARHCLGMWEGKNGNMELACKHFMIAARSGFDDSLKKVGEGYKAGFVTKDDYAKTLRAYQVSMNEMKNEQRATAEVTIGYNGP